MRWTPVGVGEFMKLGKEAIEGFRDIRGAGVELWFKMILQMNRENMVYWKVGNVEGICEKTERVCLRELEKFGYIRKVEERMWMVNPLYVNCVDENAGRMLQNGWEKLG